MSTTHETQSQRQRREARERLAGLEPSVDDEQEARELVQLADDAERLVELEQSTLRAELDYESTPQFRAGQRADAARDYRTLRERYIQRADDSAAQAAAIAREDSPDWKRYWALSDHAHHNLARAERLEPRELAHRQAARVTHEPPPYGPSSPHSWVLDVAMTRDPDLAPLMAAPDMTPRGRRGSSRTPCP
jgi:hypothetical protein